MELQLHAVIKREMKNRDISLNDLSKATGIPTSSLHNWLTERPPSGKNLTQIKKLGEYFGLSLSRLLFNMSDRGAEAKILFSSEFVDENRRYRLVIERVED